MCTRCRNLLWQSPGAKDKDVVDAADNLLLQAVRFVNLAGQGCRCHYKMDRNQVIIRYTLEGGATQGTEFVSLARTTAATSADMATSATATDPDKISSDTESAKAGTDQARASDPLAHSAMDTDTPVAPTDSKASSASTPTSSPTLKIQRALFLRQITCLRNVRHSDQTVTAELACPVTVCIQEAQKSKRLHSCMKLIKYRLYYRQFRCAVVMLRAYR